MALEEQRRTPGSRARCSSTGRCGRRAATSSSGRRADDRRLALEHGRIVARAGRTPSASTLIGCATTRVSRPRCSTVPRPDRLARRAVARPTARKFAASARCGSRRRRSRAAPRGRRPRSSRGQRVPVVRLRPRDVDEVRRDDVRPRLPHESRREVQVVVVEEERPRRARGRAPRASPSAKRLVHGHVAVAPRLVQLGAEVGRRAESPEVVLQEPERRVRDDVVEAVVRSWIVGDEPQPIGRAVRASPRRTSRRCSAATTRSSSLIALATHVTS